MGAVKAELEAPQPQTDRGPTVLMVGNFLSGTGGSRAVCEDLAIRLREAGWTVHTTSSQEGRARRLLSMLSAIWTKRRSYAIAQVDVYSGPAFLWAAAAVELLSRLRKPVVLTLHGGNLPAYAQRHPRRIRRLLSKAEVVTAPSEYLAKGLAALRPNIRRLPNPLEIGAYPFALRPKPREHLVWLRAFHEIYDPSLAAEVLARLVPTLPGVSLTMIGPDKGDGSLDRVRATAVRLGVAERLKIVPGIPKTHVGKYLSDADVFLNTTTVDNSPVSVVEAMACGLCVVSTDVGGLRDLVVDGEDGLLVPPHDAEGMAAAVLRVLREPGLASRLSAGARRKAQRLDWSLILPEWQQLFREVAETGRHVRVRPRFEYVLERRGYPLSRARSDLRATASLAPEERPRWQEARRWEIARHHAAWNGAYRDLLKGSRLPESWDRLPIVGKDFFQRPLVDCLSAGFRPSDVHQANTSGSSGVPFFFARDHYTHARTWALIAQRYGWYGLDLGSRQARFYGVPLEFWPKLRERAKDALMNRARFPVFDLSDRRLETYRRRVARGRFEYIYGYTNSLVEFARYVAQSGRSLSADAPALKVCIVTSEMCAPEDRRTLESAFGVPVVNEYGASETGVIAFEDRRGVWRLSWENLYVETVDETGRPVPPGRPGEVLITDLFNRAMPFIRYRIGDVGTLEVTGGETVLSTLEGRVNDTIVLPSGRRAAGLTFYYVARSLLEGAGAPREFIIRQTALDEFVFDVVSDAPLDGSAVRQIEEKMSLYLEPGLRLRVNPVSHIERPASGKRKHFFSEVSPSAAVEAR